VRGATTIRFLAALPPADRLLRAILQRVPRRRDVLAVLTVHRVAPADRVVPGLLSATPDGFARLLDLIASEFHVLTIEEVLERERGGPGLPPRSLLLTFDDGYRDIADHAWPALAARGMPAVVFVPSAFPGHPERSFWWERGWAAIEATRRPNVVVGGTTLPLRSPGERAAAYRAVRTLLKAGPHRDVEDVVASLEDALADGGEPRAEPSGRSLDWDELRALHLAGLAVGSHTRTHPLLTRVDRPAIAEEIRGGVDDLIRETGSSLAAFAYPSGEVPDHVEPILRDAGIRVAFTTQRGVNDLRAADWLRLRRINVAVATPPSLILAQATR
jgi:peptidoglycan/xylan/chitin deacetylase (PgdA/CDA1 family)